MQKIVDWTSRLNEWCLSDDDDERHLPAVGVVSCTNAAPESTHDTSKAPSTPATMSKQHSTLLPQTATMSNDSIVKFRPCFDIVERIVQLVAYDNVASTLLLVWTGLNTHSTDSMSLSSSSSSSGYLQCTYYKMDIKYITIVHGGNIRIGSLKLSCD